MGEDADVWARVAELEGQLLRTGKGRLFVVTRVDRAGVRVRSVPGLFERLIEPWRVAEARALAGEGADLRPRFGQDAPRLAAVLRAAGVGRAA